MTLPYADARKLVDDARGRGQELGKALSIAAVDYGGFLVLVERMDGARPMTPSIAISKAYSAAVMQRPTYLLEGWRNSDPVFFTQVGRMGQHPIVATKGGFTLKRDGVILGGFGVSGGSPNEDQKICEDVLRAAGFDLEFPEWAGVKSADLFVLAGGPDTIAPFALRAAREDIGGYGGSFPRAITAWLRHLDENRRRLSWLTTTDITLTTTGRWSGPARCWPPGRR